jgi:hypothetical protein
MLAITQEVAAGRLGLCGILLLERVQCFHPGNVMLHNRLHRGRQILALGGSKVEQQGADLLDEVVLELCRVNLFVVQQLRQLLVLVRESLDLDNRSARQLNDPFSGDRPAHLLLTGILGRPLEESNRLQILLGVIQSVRDKNAQRLGDMANGSIHLHSRTDQLPTSWRDATTYHRQMCLLNMLDILDSLFRHLPLLGHPRHQVLLQLFLGTRDIGIQRQRILVVFPRACFRPLDRLAKVLELAVEVRLVLLETLGTSARKGVEFLIEHAAKIRMDGFEGLDILVKSVGQ